MKRLFAVIAVSMALPAVAADLNTRVDRLERVINSGTLIELLDKVEQLESMVRDLSGEIELQSHVINQLKQHQRDLYLDVDKRLQQVEMGVSEGATAGSQPVVFTSDPAAATTTDTGQGTDPVSQPVQPVAVQQPVQPEVDPAIEQDRYRAAFNLLKEGRYNQATEAFQDFIRDYPAGSYTDNAQYWLGETFYVTRQFQPALTEFNRVVNDHKDSPKLTHALLKIGYIRHELGDSEGAVKTLEGLMAQHPKSTAARLARERLSRIKKESR